MFDNGTIYLLACLCVVFSYLLVGKVIWHGILGHMSRDVHGLVMLDQLKRASYAALIPKFTVILLWPVIAVFGIVASVYSAYRAAPTSNV